ncbi:hypothetical protein [Neobacillus dielmonensis]|uniref:hypothetical protein n=1 Tax=Neobacillus dielmonensis TaxID=1347369 RepID=UPI0005A96A29|nr:hypothetical protein [Neobacillus dielmonensis]
MAKKKKQKNKSVSSKYRQLPTGNSVVREIEQKLNQYYTTGDHTLYGGPDYAGFLTWIFEKLSNEDDGANSIQPRYKNSFSSSKLQYFMGLILLKDKYEKEWHQTLKPGKTRNKYKLLLSAWDKMDPRAKEFVEAKRLEEKRIEDLDEGLDECSPAQLRIRFFLAMHSKKERIAFKILGKLKDQDHDEGELNYLEALSCFHSNDFTGAIQYAQKLKSGQIDFPSAQALILESYALLGDVSHLSQCLETQQGKISFPFFMYIMQQAVLHSDNYEDDIRQIEAILSKHSDNMIEMDQSSLPVFNRFSCQLATEFLERAQEKDVQLLAYEQHISVPAKEEDFIKDLLDVRDYKLNFALKFHPSLYDELMNEENPTQVIVRYVLTDAYELTEEDYITVFMAQYRLQEKEQFVENILRNRKQILAFHDQRKWELFELAYLEALALRHNKTKVIENILAEREDFLQLKETYEEKAKETSWLASLSPMGRLSYETAVSMYDRSIEEGFRWKDAGMISLGFFRILEVEINEKCIVPVSKTISYETLEEELSKLKADGSKKAQDLFHFWESIYRNLLFIRDGSKSGLELGLLNYLFGKVTSDSGKDKNLKRLFYNELTNYFTEEGLLALASGQIADWFNQEVRNRFRNPPAHTKFVSLKVAGECRDYVQNILGLLHQYLVQDVVKIF